MNIGNLFCHSLFDMTPVGCILFAFITSNSQHCCLGTFSKVAIVTVCKVALGTVRKVTLTYSVPTLTRNNVTVIRLLPFYFTQLFS